MPLLLSDIEFVEGFLGALGWILAHIYFKRYFKKENLFIVGAVCYLIVWFTRKLWLNVYIKWRNQNLNYAKKIGIFIPNFTKLPDFIFDGLILLILTLILYFLFVYNNPVKNTFSPLAVSEYVIIFIFLMLAITVFTPVERIEKKPINNN